MSYYIGATGEYIWEELLDNATSNVAIANHINLDAGPLTEAAQQIITDAAGTALGELIGSTTQVPSALGQALITLSALGLLAYNKLNRTAVQDVDSMVYSADYASILTPGMFDDRVRIRYDSNYFSNAFYYEDNVKKGEILTSRINLLPVDSNNIDLYTLTGKVGIGITSPATQLHLYATNNILRLQTAPVDGTNSIEFVRGSITDPLNDYRLHTDTTGKFKLQYSTNAIAYGGTGSDLIHVSPTNINIYKDTEITGNVGIGTTPITSFHTYHATNNIMRLGTATNGKVSIEFVRGTDIDGYNDFRLINDAGTFRLQYEDDELGYGNTGTDLISASTTQISLGKKTEIMGNVGIGTSIHETYKLNVNGTSRFTGNVGIGTTPHETYKLDALGTINATAFRGDGSAITGLNQDNLVLTTTKLYQNFNTTNFAIINDKIDLPPNYSFTITGYDSQTLFNPSTDRKYKGKMSCSYDDRNGVYKILTEENKTTNVAVLQYKVGDKITIRNTADPKLDYLLYNGFKYFNSLYLVKRPISQPVSWTNVAWQPHMYEWRSGDGLDGRPDAYIYKPGEIQVYPFTTPISFIIETGFNYYLFKLYNEVDTAGGTIIIRASGYGDDFNDFNRAFGAGQTFKLQTGSGFINTEYIPTAYIAADISVASDRRVGVVKPRARVSVDASGNLDADIPTSAELITNMNTTHFTNNTGTSKIDISSSYVAPNATKLATARNIAGVSFDGTGNIDIPYSGLTSVPTTWSVSQIPDLGAGKITSGTFSTDRIPDLGAGKITSGTFDVARIPNLDTGKITSGTFADARIPNLDTGKITTGTFADVRIPSLDTGKITTGTFADARIPSLDTGKITTGTFADARIPSLAISKTTGLQTALDGKASTSHTHAISDITGLQTALDGKAPTSHTHTIANVSGLQTALDGKAPTSHTHIISDTTGLQTALDGKAPTSHTHTIANITGLQTALDGKAPTSHTHAITDITNLQTTLGTLQPRINSTAGQIIIGNGDGITTTSTGLTWTTATLNATNLTTTNTLTTPNLAVSTQATITQLLTGTGGTLGTDMFSLVNNSTNSLRFSQVYIGANDQKWLLIQKTNNVDNTIFNFRNGNIAVGTFSNPAYRIDLVGDINITGEFRKNTNIYKPANAVLADTATVATSLATSRNIAGVPFNGTADINIDYNALNNRPIILQPTTTNLQLVSGFTLSVPGNVGVGTTAIATNVLQVGSGARLRIANNATDYTIIGTNDTDGATNTQIIISGNTRATNAGNIQYLATATNGSHLFYTTATSIRMTIANTGVNINNDLGVSGNVGIGTAPSATYKVNINGTLNATSVLIGGNAITGSKWSNGAVATNIFYNSGNVGIGASTTSDIDDNPAAGFVIPTARLYVRGGESAGGTCDVVIRGGVAGQNNGKARLWLMGDASHSSYIESHHIGSGFTNLTLGTSSGNVLPTERMKINYNGAVGIQTNGYAIPNNFMTAGSLTIGNQDTDYGGGNNWTANTAGLMMECANNTEIVIHDAGNSLHSFMRYTNNGNFTIGRNMGYGVANLSVGGYVASESFLQGRGAGGYFRIERFDSWVRLRDGGTTHVDFAAGQLFAHSQITGNVIVSNNGIANSAGNIVNTGEYFGRFYSVPMTNSDYLSIQNNTSLNTLTSNWIRVAFGSFTAFHRCYTDDVLYNNETDESIDLFKNNYMGRVVIATGKIKTDLSRKKETEPEPEPEPEIDSMTGLPKIKQLKPDENEWYSEIDKDGIAIEDAIPVVALSRQKKDKRVFGVLGAPTRNTNNKDRLIVNSIGEGAICVSNTNGNIENGDYIQSSDLLGYGEKQDDDLLHNYTIAKATIDCDFELDSPYYQCHEIENGVRVAFIACSYHCG